MAMRVLRAPLLHFLIGGAVLFRLVYGPAPFSAVARGGEAAAIAVTSADVERLRTEYAQETGLTPTDHDEAALVDRAIDEELLLRDALEHGLDRNDRSVRTWLIQQMSALSESRDGDPETLYRQARALGLDRTDVVVRRILVQKMRLLAGRIGDHVPSEEALREFYDAHRDEYAPPARVNLSHVYFSSERGAEAERRAQSLLERLHAQSLGFDDALGAGDSFAVANRLAGQSPAQIEKLFGPEFAVRIAHAEPQRWFGPVVSAYGMHLVRIDGREAGAPPSLESVRERLVERWQDEQRAERIAERLRELRGRYSLHVESAAWQLRRTS